MGSLDDCYHYNSISETFTKKQSLPIGMYLMGGVLISESSGDKVIIATAGNTFKDTVFK